MRPMDLANVIEKMFIGLSVASTNANHKTVNEVIRIVKELSEFTSSDALEVLEKIVALNLLPEFVEWEYADIGAKFAASEARESSFGISGGGGISGFLVTANFAQKYSNAASEAMTINVRFRPVDRVLKMQEIVSQYAYKNMDWLEVPKIPKLPGSTE